MRIGKQLQECAVDWITLPVLWSQIMSQLKNYDLIIQIGPGTQLRDMIQKQYQNKKVIAINNRTDIEELKTILGLQKEAVEK